MRLFLIISILLISSTSVYGTGFKLTRLEHYGKTPGIELSLFPNKGNTLNEIFNVIELPNGDFYLRLIGVSSEKTNSEILQFYRDHLPKELDIALLKPTGRLHDSTLPPLANSFGDALKSTSLYLSLTKELTKRGFKVNKIEFEKFSVEKNGIIRIPDVYLRCIKD